MVMVEGGKDAQIADSVKSVFSETTGYAYGQLCHSTMVDVAALGVSSELGHEREGCDMHQDDKIARSAIGDLVRTRNKKPINPFDACQKLLAKVRNIAKYFSYSDRLQELWRLSGLIEGGLAQVRFQLDLNGTRVAAKHQLLLSVLRLNRGLKMWASAKGDDYKLGDVEWEAVAEIEAVLRISGSRSTIVQYEQLFMGAIGPVIHQKILDEYASAELDVLDLAAITKDSKLPRIKRSHDDLTEIGAECLRRAHLEAERRHCDNKTELILLDSVQPSEREKMAMMLDPRTIGLVESDQRPSHLELLKSLYISHAKKARNIDAQPAPAPAPAPTPPTAPAPAPPPRRMQGAAWSDDEAEDDDDDEPIAQTVDVDIALGSEFDVCYRNYRDAVVRLVWPDLFPELELSETYTAMDLMEADVGRVLSRFMEDPELSKYGYLPRMATHSRASIGSLLASSFAERINSAANLILTKGNTLLADEEINMCTVLRMNKKFKTFMREHHPDAAQQHLKMTVIHDTNSQAD